MSLKKSFLSCLANIVYPKKVYGLENVPKDGGVLFTYNHLSAVDPFFIFTIYHKDMNFIAKKELFENKIVAWTLKTAGAYCIDRDNPDPVIMMKIFKSLRSGHKVAISPEGTRNKSGNTDFLPFKQGAVLFAVKGRAKVVPVIVKNKAKAFRKTKVMFGKPIDFSEYYDKKLSDEDIDALNGILREKMYETQNELFALTQKKKKKDEGKLK